MFAIFQKLIVKANRNIILKNMQLMDALKLGDDPNNTLQQLTHPKQGVGSGVK